MSPDAFIAAYETALAAQDWDQVAPLIHNDACVTFSDGSYHTGKTAVRSAFERNFKRIDNERYIIRDVHWVDHGDRYAVCVYSFQWKGLIDGKPAGGRGRGTAVLIHTGDGWQLLAEHLGPAEPRQQQQQQQQQ